MLGFLYKCAHGTVSLSTQGVFCHAPPQTGRSLRRGRHTLALLERCDGRHLGILKNGAVGAVEVFNRLTEEVVRLPDVHAFQSALTQTARSALRSGHVRWSYIFQAAYCIDSTDIRIVC